MRLYTFSYGKQDKYYEISLNYNGYKGFDIPKKHLLFLIKSATKHKLVMETVCSDPLPNLHNGYYRYISFPAEYILYLTLYCNKNQYDRILGRLNKNGEPHKIK